MASSRKKSGASASSKSGEEDIPSDAVPAPGGEIASEASFSASDTATRVSGPARETRTAVAETSEARKEALPDTAPGGKEPPDLERPPNAETPSAPSENRSSGGGGFLPMLLGGVAAGLIGFAVARYSVPETTTEIDSPSADQTESISALAAQIAEIGDRLDGLGETADPGSGLSADDLQALADETAQAITDLDERLGDVAPELSSVSERIAAIESQISPMMERIEGLEARPVPEETNLGDAAIEARVEAFRTRLDQELAAARAEMEAARDEAAEVVESAQTQARRSEDRAQISQIETALATGRPYSTALDNLSVEVPEDLSGPGDEGVATLAVLQEDFIPAARSALAVAPRGSGEASALGRVAAFLREQTNARSLTPQEGDSVDAILSRAEAALGEGNLEAAVTELEALPEGPAERFGDWLSRARTRLAATRALTALEDTLDAN